MMNKTIKTLLFSAIIPLFFGIDSFAFAQCIMPKNPVIPSGKTATKDQILKAIKYIKNDYQLAIEDVQNCIQNEQATVGEYATKDQELKWTELYNHAFNLQRFFVSKLNTEIREYKKAHETASEKPVTKATPPQK
jgi:hypothetical protein